MVDFTKFLPSKVCFCLEFDPGAKILLGLIILFRFICMILGCLYGPYLYLVLPLGGLYLAADVLLLYTIFGSGINLLNNNETPNASKTDSAETSSTSEVNCDFKTQKIWIFIWLGMNLLGMIGLLVVVGLFGDLGWWSMTYQPLHVAVFFLVLILLVLLIYGQLIVITLYLILKDAWVRGILGNGTDEDMAGLTHNGKRIYA